MLSFLSELHVYVLYLKLLEGYRDYQESSVLAGFLDLASFMHVLVAVLQFRGVGSSLSYSVY